MINSAMSLTAADWRPVRGDVAQPLQVPVRRPLPLLPRHDAGRAPSIPASQPSLARSATARLDRAHAASHRTEHADDDQQPQTADPRASGASGHSSVAAAAVADKSDASRALQLQLPGGQSLTVFMGLWDQLTGRLLPRDTTGPAAGTLLAALQLLLASIVSRTAVPRAAGAPAAGVSAPAAGIAQRLHPAAAQPQPLLLDGQLLAVALHLADLSAAGMPLDAEAIAAGILADAVRRDALSMDAVQAKLGSSIVRLLSEVTAVHALSDAVDVYDDSTSSALRELALKVYDRRAIVIEVVSRLHALRSVAGLPLHEQQVTALEALQLYAPMGHAMGLAQLSTTIEDICFQILFPASYAETAAWLRKTSISNEGTLQRCISQLQAELCANQQLQHLTAGVELHGRTKSLFSAMRKILRLGEMQQGGRQLSQLHDLLGLRAVVQPRTDVPAEVAHQKVIEACYIVSDTVQQLWTPVTERFKDYIQHPKNNSYQSIHAIVQVPAVLLDMEAVDAGAAAGGSLGAQQASRVLDHSPKMEVQIRTQDMHMRAEFGDAAHAMYKGRLDDSQSSQLRSWTETAPTSLVLPGDVPHTQRSQAAAVELFRHLDQNGDGMLSREEVQIMISSLRPFGPHDTAATQEVMDSIAETGSDDIDFASFLHWFHQIEGLLGPGPAAAVAAESQADRLLSASSSQPLPEVPAQPEQLSGTEVAPGTDAAAGTDPVVSSSSSDTSSAARADAEADIGDEQPPEGRASSAGLFRGVIRVLAAEVIGIEEAGNSTGSSQRGRSTARQHSRPGHDSDNDSWSAAEDSDADTACSPLATLPFSPEPFHQQQARHGAGPPATGGSASGKAAGADAPGSSGQQQLQQQGDAARRSDNGAAADASPAVRRRPLRRAPPSPTASQDPAEAAPKSPKHRRRSFDLKQRLRLVPSGDAAWQTASGVALDEQHGVQLPSFGPFVLGADSTNDCDIVSKAPGVSGRHARLELVRHKKTARCLLTDLGSRTGTFHNGAQLRPYSDTRISVGDTIALGQEGASITVAAVGYSATEQPESRSATAAALQHFPQDMAAPLQAGFIAENGRVVYTDVPARATELMREGNMQEAASLLQGQLRQTPRRGGLWSQLANVERRRAKKREAGAMHAAARAYYRAAAQLLASGPAATASMGSSMDFSATAAGAESQLSSIDESEAQQQSSLCRALDSWAQMEFWLRHNTSGRRLFQRSIGAAQRQGSRSVRSHLQWARLERNNSNHALAKQLLEKVLAVAPQYAAALRVRAALEIDSGGSADEAREFFRRAQAAAPDTAHTLQAWGRLEAAEGDLAAARQLFEQALVLDPDNVYVLQAWAVAEGNVGDFDRARERFAHAVGIAPKSAPTWHAWAHLEGRTGDVGRARELYRTALGIKPTAVTLSSLATLERRCGNLEEAEMLVKQALEIDPFHKPALSAQTIIRKGQQAAAQAAAQRA